MKNSTLVVFLLLTGFSSLRAGESAAPFHTDNIVLKNFQAIHAGVGAKIIWEFTSEEKDVTCNLEKSTDGVNFVTLRTIVLRSTREQALHYYHDKEANGKLFYRLRITKESYFPYISPIVSVAVSGATTAQQQMPIPVLRSTVFGELAAQDVPVSLKLVDLTGHPKMDQDMKGTDLERNFRSLFRRLPAGYYVLRVNSTDNKTLLRKMIYKF